MMVSLTLEIKSQGYKILPIWQTLVCFLIATLLTSNAWAEDWQTLSAGIEYRDMGAHALNRWSHIHVFRVNLNEVSLDIVMSQDLKKPQATVEEFATHANALLAVNGGFFDHQLNPLGLRIRHKKQYTPLKPISWWGIFYVKDNVPHLSSMSHFASHKDINFAIQSGPRLIIRGKIPSLKPGWAERTALGITKDKHVIILVTENTPLTTTGLAELMQSPALQCTDALNLDGGGSSQLFAKMKHFQLNIPGYSKVSDAIVVKSSESLTN